MFFATRQKFADSPEVLIEFESRGNDVTLTWNSWRKLVFQYTGYRNMTKHAMEFCFCSMHLWVQDFSTCCHGEISCTWLSKMMYLLLSQTPYHSFNSIRQNSLKFTTEQLQEVTIFLSWKNVRAAQSFLNNFFFSYVQEKFAVNEITYMVFAFLCKFLEDRVHIFNQNLRLVFNSLEWLKSQQFS